ncbi:cyclopropane fatty acid synthase [Tieghemostelium lacteum]|uniref:Cyclopropane fatty acid synthase n=1 Tax=Tieghemostelium lacteum TaxID=361077 RepID=A0A151ZDY4_TIELA|nr:cyclopropane fatty acid synthase [Tieghemostelium lacteum]|eukprot:KYQ92120.1 cyclopropane fatty acid synthase [Tieghemostelium lacteum]
MNALTYFKTYASDSFVKYSHNILFNQILEKFTVGQLTLDIIDLNYPEYNCKSRIYGDKSKSPQMKSRITIKNLYRFLFKVSFSYDVGLGESYVFGDFDSDDLTTLLKMFILNGECIDMNGKFKFLRKKFDKFINFFYNQTTLKNQENIQTHYNLSNDFYRLVLGEEMLYSSGIFMDKNESLSVGSMRQIRGILEMANLKKGEKVLEIGSGWGSLSIEAAKSYGCHVTGVTLSKEQRKIHLDRIEKEGLQDLIDVQLKHYRDIEGKFDKIISIEMCEHVSDKYYPEYFQTIEKALSKDGIVVLQMIAYNDQMLDEYLSEVGFISKYIFLEGYLTSITKLLSFITKNTNLVIESVKNIGPHYEHSLVYWNKNLLANKDKILEMGIDEQLIRLYSFYFSYCAAGFGARFLNDYQVVLSRPLNIKNLKPLP